MSRIDDDYLRLLVRALPDCAETAHYLSGIVTLVQNAKAALRDGEPDGAVRADVALTMVLTMLTRLTLGFDKAARKRAQRRRRASLLQAPPASIPAPTHFWRHCRRPR